MGRVWALGPTGPSCFGQGCVWQKTLLCLFHVFLFPFYFDIWPNKPIFDIKKFPNIWRPSWIHLWPLHTLFYFFLCVFVFFMLCAQSMDHYC
jgi:hypothetical protein